MELDPISCILPWDLFEKILGSLGCPHICYHIARQLCKKTRNELLPRLVDWYFVEWWYSLNHNYNDPDLQQWTTVSCVWKSKKEKHMKKTSNTFIGDYQRTMPVDHIRFCIPFKQERTITIKKDQHPIVFQCKKDVESTCCIESMQLVHVYFSKKYILGGYATINSGRKISVRDVRNGEYVLTEYGKFKHLVTKRIVMESWYWITFIKEKYNMFLHVTDSVTIL